MGIVLFRAGATLAVGLAVLAAQNARAEPPARPKEAAGPLFHPDGPGSGRLRVGVGILMDVLPKRVVESEQRQFPQVTTHARLGGPFGFSASARLAAIVIKNEIDLGLVWSHTFGPISLGLSEHVGFSYGVLAVQGFDATSWAWMVAARSDAPIRATGLWISGLTVAAAAGLGFALRRWTRAPKNGAPLLAAAGVPDAFDERLDAELDDLDGH